MTLIVVIALVLVVVLALTESARITSAMDNAEARIHLNISEIKKAVSRVEASLKEKL